MYQLENTSNLTTDNDIDNNIIDAFIKGQDLLRSLMMYSSLQWEEHCTECAMPSCYQTCELYQARRDGHCRRFTHGFQPIQIPERRHAVVKVEFKRWGALMCKSRIGVLPVKHANRYERISKYAEIISNYSKPFDRVSIRGRQGIIPRLVTRLKRCMLTHAHLSFDIDGFIIEFFCISAVDFNLTIRSTQGEKNKTPFQHRIVKKKGYHQVIIPFSQMCEHIYQNAEHFITIIPNNPESDQQNTIYFGFLGFYKSNHATSPNKERKSIKVLVWDLDNTIWDGILIEDEADNISLRENITDILSELDHRGIMNSISSKNDYDTAWSQLKKFDLDKYFLFPQINWNPKSQSIQQIATDFNISIENIAFIDDSEFEKQEVKQALPQVTIIDHHDYTRILDRPEFNPKVSSESSQRRTFYINQQNRDVAYSTSSNYLEFIAQCEISLSIAKATSAHIQRIHELVQRTNQMNFSSNRYDYQALCEKLDNPNNLPLYLTAHDKFGDYGTIGFCLIDLNCQCVTDLMFSCRIQSKMVEHAFLNWLTCCCFQSNWTYLHIDYNPTQKNKQSARVFDDLNFTFNSKSSQYTKRACCDHTEHLIHINADHSIINTMRNHQIK